MWLAQIQAETGIKYANVTLKIKISLWCFRPYTCSLISNKHKGMSSIKVNNVYNIFNYKFAAIYSGTNCY